MDGDGPRHGNFAPVSLTSRRPPIQRWAVIATVVLVVVVAKPWQSASDGGSAGVARTPGPPAPQPTAAPTPQPSGDALKQAVASFCLDTRTWLIASVERSFERTGEERIRVWRAFVPAVSASGPADPTIPRVSIVSEGLAELGWCAPTMDGPAPTPPVDIDAWVQVPGGTRSIVLDSSRPVSTPNPYGALYVPPGSGRGLRVTWWPNGTYVFRYSEGQVAERWFAIEVETRPLPSPTH